MLDVINSQTMKVYSYNICKYDFFDTAVADIIRAIDGGSLMGGLILAFCCIDYMGMAMNPFKIKNTGFEFKKFVKDYLGKINPEYTKLENEIWAVRNSLIHVYGESDASKKKNLLFHFGHQYPENHLNINERDVKEIWFNLPNFIGELVASIEFFFRYNKSEEEKLKEWYRKLITVQGAPGLMSRLVGTSGDKVRHSISHRYFDILDQQPSPKLENIKDYITNKIDKYLDNST